MMGIKSTVQELAKARAEAETTNASLKIAQSALEERIGRLPEALEFNRVGKKNEDAKSKVSVLEEKFKAQLIEEYKGSGAEKKKQFDGGSVAIGKKYFYDDEKIIAWLHAHNYHDLVTSTYPKNEVKKLSTVGKGVDGVTTEETITPKIDSDLSKFLEDK
jgi:hypothetical protein